MIRSICLNPTIDRNYYLTGFRAGTQYKGSVPVLGIGGKGVNVARACALLGAEVSCYGLAGEIGFSRVTDSLEGLCRAVRFFAVPGETRVSVNIIDPAGRTETEIMERGPLATRAACDALLDALRADTEAGDIVVCSGIAMPDVPVDYYPRVARMCDEKGARCLLDTNGPNLTASVRGHYFLAKPNHLELAELCGCAPSRELADIARMARRVPGRIDHLFVSMGPTGGALFSRDGATLVASVPDVAVESTIGCGDSAIAGFATALARGESLAECFRFALACGTANCLTRDVACFTRESAEELLGRIRVEAAEG